VTAIALQIGVGLALGEIGCEKAASVSIEHELVQRALEGDGRAFQTLVQPHLAMLYRIAARACGDRALAEDAVQEALTLAHQRLDRYQPDTSLRAFLAAIAVRRAQTLLRTERRRHLREEAADPPEQEASPADVLAAARTARRVREVLATLPKKRRAVALLRLDAGMSYAEIAEAIGTSEGSARVLVHLALKELREKLEDILT
jgi:RNA polymerase sigma-70 factor, ECF subfamily